MCSSYAPLLIVLLIASLASFHSAASRSRVVRRTSNSAANSNFKCGVRHQQPKGLVSKGTVAEAGQWPWHAAVYQRESRVKVYKCGATLIGQYFVLTAAHCLISEETGYEISPRLVTIQLGKLDLNEYSLNFQEHRADDIFVHPEYDAITKRNDIALISLRTIVHFNEYVLPACLEQPDRSTKITEFVGHFGTAVGWGLTEDETMSTVLKEANMPVVNHFECLESNPDLFSRTLFEGMFCAGSRNGTSVCNGDSGGGLFFRFGERWIVRGITSFAALRAKSFYCDVNSYVGFANVQHYLGWIRDTMNSSDAAIEAFGAELALSVSTTTEKTTAVPTLSEILCQQQIVRDAKKNGVCQNPRPLYMVSLIYKDIETNTHITICAGSLISSNYILTAARCVIPQRNSIRYQINAARFGGIADTNFKHVDVGVLRSVLHPNYRTELNYNDIALVQLVRDVPSFSTFFPACLATKKTNISSPILAGFSSTFVNGSEQMALFTVPYAWTSNETCFSAYQESRRMPLGVAEQQMCATVSRQRETDSCDAFEGGALFVQDSQDCSYHLIGIYNMGANNCGLQGSPHLFTRISSYTAWIMLELVGQLYV